MASACYSNTQTASYSLKRVTLSMMIKKETLFIEFLFNPLFTKLFNEKWV